MGSDSAFVSSARRLVAEATPGPWKEGGPWPTISVIHQTAAGYCGPDGGAPPEYDAVCIIWQGVDCTGRMLPEHPDRARHLADAKLIPFAVNHLAALADVVEAAEKYKAARRYFTELNEVVDDETGAALDDVRTTLAALDAALAALEVKR